MSRPLLYMDTSDVQPGRLQALKGAIEELVQFVDASEPRLLAYNVYLSDDGSRMTVVHVHADSASLEHHLDVGGPAFRKLADLITLTSIRIYGEPSEKALGLLHDKARLLGYDDVIVQGPHAGFSRFGRAGAGG